MSAECADPEPRDSYGSVQRLTPVGALRRRGGGLLGASLRGTSFGLHLARSNGLRGRGWREHKGDFKINHVSKLLTDACCILVEKRMKQFYKHW